MGKKMLVWKGIAISHCMRPQLILPWQLSSHSMGTPSSSPTESYLRAVLEYL